MTTGMRERLVGLVEPLLERLGYELVDLEFSGGRGSAMLRVFIDRQTGVGIEDCEAVSREISALLDLNDPIASEYTLEVSSPGIDRPLFTIAQFGRYIGEQAKINLRLPQDGRRRLHGRIVRVEGDSVVIAEEKGEYTVAKDNIEKARLVPDLVALGLAAQPKKPGGQRGKRRKPDPSGKPESSDIG